MSAAVTPKATILKSVDAERKVVRAVIIKGWSSTIAIVISLIKPTQKSHH